MAIKNGHCNFTLCQQILQFPTITITPLYSVLVRYTSRSIQRVEKLHRRAGTSVRGSIHFMGSLRELGILSLKKRRLIRDLTGHFTYLEACHTVANQELAVHNAKLIILSCRKANSG